MPVKTRKKDSQQLSGGNAHVGGEDLEALFVKGVYESLGTPGRSADDTTVAEFFEQGRLIFGRFHSHQPVVQGLEGAFRVEEGR